MSLAAALRKLGFTMLREGQDKIIESLMRGDDTIGILPTSGGKSACYQIPGLCKGYKVLIFSPLVALMKDQMESMLRRGLKADQISSGQTPRENISSLNRWAQDLIQFLLVSPERMGSTEFQETMLKFPPDLLVVDECFTPDVEILTSRGFIRFDALMETDLCAQYDSDTKGISFVVPEKFIKKQYDGKVVHITAPKLCDIMATPNHEFLVLNKTTKKFKKETFEKIKFNSFKHAKVAGYKTGGSSDILTPQEKFLIAYQADGSLHRQSQNHKQLAFSFTKQRKIDRFLSLCKACNLNVWEVNDRVGRRRFMVQSQVASKLLRDNFRPCDMTLSKCKAFIEEMVHWDGSIISTNTYYYSSTIKDNTDLVQEVALLAGYKTNQTIERDNRSSNYNDVHRLFILKNRDYIGTSQFKKEEQDYNGFVYCVRVPKHNIIVRRNGKPLVVGNCHCVSQWADSFRPNYRMIGSFIETYNPKQVLAITATCTKEIEADIRNYLKLEHATRVLSFPVRENLHLSSRVVDCFDDAVLEAVSTIRKDPTQPTIIYCATVKNVTAVYDYLCRIGYGEKAGMYHGQLPPDQRNSVQTMFMHDKISIMVATNAFGMGVDKPNIRRVIHLDIPNSIESLSQEIGRSGRDGLNSYCISYYYDQALSLQEWFIENKYPEEKYIREIYKAFPRYKKGNSIEVTGSTLAKDLGLNSGVVDSCMNLLISNEIIERENAEDKTTTIKLESNKEDVVLKLSSQKQRFYAKLVDALHSMTITTTDTFSVPIMGLSEVMMETMTTLKNNLKALTEAGVIDYQAPFTGKPFKILQTLDNFDFKMLALRRSTSFRKLKELTQYYFIDDAFKQKFMQDYFTAINS